ncbi:ABC transporter ATP-binding protein [Amycolatopsis alkalitolerans]|uniref:ABC transporter ATP-binding protein n=1 Tax=Amycolatopsis alkalitolerans TaxID=2547244 RepID=UPI001359C716|nr:ABC transporter ATP-binding protein [Amycolatopsis alkalitolerans]
MTFGVPRGQFLAIVGPSGCGKTTVLNMMAGLIRPTSGEVYRNGQPAVRVDRSVGYMFARPGLMPWRTVSDNIKLGLEFRGVRRRTRAEEADRLLVLVGLANYRDAYPAELSQGMRQRAALARTLALDPEFLLMDEPFGALDAQTKILMQEEFTKVWEGTDKTVVFVTHDVSEAIALADRVLVFTASPGRIKAEIDIGLPRPRHPDSLRFDATYQKYFERIWNELRGEVIVS